MHGRRGSSRNQRKLHHLGKVRRNCMNLFATCSITRDKRFKNLIQPFHMSRWPIQALELTDEQTKRTCVIPRRILPFQMIKIINATSTMRKGAKETNTLRFKRQSFKAMSRTSPRKPATQLCYTIGNLYKSKRNSNS